MPRLGLLTLNISGAQEPGGYARLLNTCKKWRTDHGINVFCFQEHNLHPAQGKLADVETAGILFLAWRCLYAETTRARIEGHPLRLSATYARLVLMIISRLKAQGTKWRRWYSRTHNTTKKKEFPQRYRKRKLIKTEANADFKINQSLLREYDRIKQDRRID